MELNRSFYQDVLRSQIFNNLSLLLGLLLLWGCFLFATQVLEPARPRREPGYLPPPGIQHFTFGMKEQIADFLWLRALQDFEYCEKEIEKGVCQGRGWLFQMLDLVTDLSPAFRMPYSVGGLALSVLANDQQGASRIYEKAVQQFPFDWPILSRAAYHAMVEEGSNAKAARLLKAAADHGAPPWYYLLSTRVASREGDVLFAEEIIRQLEATPKRDEILLKNLRRRLERMKKGALIDDRELEARKEKAGSSSN